jgi:hypothetical protein
MVIEALKETHFVIQFTRKYSRQCKNNNSQKQPMKIDLTVATVPCTKHRAMEVSLHAFKHGTKW